MTVTESLGIQYLWVDAICILQDNTPDKMAHLGLMGQIYNYALFTIIAACGSNAEAGLVGVREPRAVSQQIIKIVDERSDKPEIYIITSSARRILFGELYKADNSVWATRGWTLQERVVSRRGLTFTPSQMYWSCRAASWSEDLFPETSIASIISRIYNSSTSFLMADGTVWASRRDDRTDVAWNQFLRLIKDFSLRHLTAPGDAYDAFSAINQEFKSTTGVFFPLLFAHHSV